MRTNFSRSIVILAAGMLLALSGCGPTKPLAQSTKNLTDLGRHALPNSTYQLHGYELELEGKDPHIIYIVENIEGVPIAGTSSHYTESDGNTSHQIAINSAVAPTVLPATPAAAETTSKPISVDVKLTCESVEQCQRKLQAFANAQ